MKTRAAIPRLLLAAAVCLTQIIPLSAQIAEGPRPGAGRTATSGISGAASLQSGLFSPIATPPTLDFSLSPLQTPTIRTEAPSAAEAPIAPAEGPASAEESELPAQKIGSLRKLSPENAAPRLETHRKEFEALGQRPPQDLPSTVAVASSKSKTFLKPYSHKLVTAALTAILGVGALIATPLTPQNAVLWQMPRAALAQVAQKQDSGYMQAASVEDVVKNFNPQVKLYVVGDVGLDKAALKDLSSALAGKHWTVVLVADAEGQSYRDVDGNARYSQEAVEYRLGQQLGRLGAFQQQANALSKQADGTILEITLNPHGLWYYPSKTQTDLGLGKEQFKGNLDRWAISSMRSGGDIAGAVKGTIENINSQVNSSLAQSFQGAQAKIAEASSALSTLEKESSKFYKGHPTSAINREDIAGLQNRLKSAQAAYDSGKAVEALQTASAVLATAQQAASAMSGFEASAASAVGTIKEASAETDSLAAASAQLRASHSGLTGDIARPDIKAFREKLQGASSLIEKNPAQAAQIASAVRAEVRTSGQAILEYPAGKAALDAAQGDLKTQQGRLRASSAQEQLKSAQSSLKDARISYEKGDSSYASLLSQSKTAIAGADSAISSADSAAAARSAALWILLSLLTFGAAGLGFFLNRRVRGIRSEAEKLYTDWNSALAKKVDVLFGELETRMKTFIGPASGAEKRDFTGETLRVAEQTREAIGTLSVLWASANGVLEQAKGLLAPAGSLARLYNFFFASHLDHALRLLKDEPVAFKADDGIERIYGKEPNWREDLYGDLKAYEPFKKSFAELVKDFNETSKLAVKNLNDLEAAETNFGPLMGSASGLINNAKAKAAEVAQAGSSDGLFLAPSLGAKLLPAAAAALNALKANFEKDPLGAMKGSGAEAERMAQEASALGDAILGLRASVIPGAAVSSAQLKAANVATEWIDKALKRLSGRAETLAASASVPGATIAAATAEFISDAAALGKKISRAAELTALLDRAQSESIEKTAARIGSAREALGAQIGVDPSRILSEKGANPSDRIDAAKKQAAAARTALGAGGTDAAEKAIDEIGRLSAEAAAIVAASQNAASAQGKTVLERASETSRIEGLIPEHQAVLDKIRTKFAASVLSLKAGDPTHPGANGTVDDNIDEANESLAAAKQKLAKSVDSFKAGAILAAAELLRQVQAQQQFALYRLSEITDKQARLDQTMAANQRMIGQLESRVTGYDSEVSSDKRSMNPTLAAFAAARRMLSEGRDAANAAKGDPFKAHEALSSTAAALDQMYVQARNDRDAYANAERNLKAAAAQLAAGQALASQAANDSVADSPAIIQAYRDLNVQAGELSRAKDAFAVPHGDWNAVDVRANAVANAAAKAAATLKSEIAEAESAVAAISNAATKLREAGNWTGSYGVYIPGTPGSSELGSARSALEQGRYSEASRAAQSASAVAAAAIAAAIAEVARIKRQKEEEEARQRRLQRQREEEEEARQRRNNDSSSSSGGGSSWGSSDSGGGSSSYGSSDSGGGSSSW